jgi:ribosomal-protein-alanine N-acetyltransferase
MDSPAIIAQSDRVTLRYPVESDRDAFVALRRSSRAHLEPWEPIPPSGLDLYSPEAFDREFETHNTEREQRWLIIERDTNTIAGRIALTNIERGPFQNGRFGYWLGAGFEGKGLMSDALTLAIAHCFRPITESGLGLHRVCANIMPSNTRSRNLLQRAGFVREGFSEKYLQIQGNWEDHERWALTTQSAPLPINTANPPTP